MTRLSTKNIADQINAKLDTIESSPEEDVRNLDGDDTVRLENVILKQHVEQLTRKLEDDRRKDAEKILRQVQDDYQNYLANKYGVDTSTHRITVDAKTYTLNITPLE